MFDEIARTAGGIRVATCTRMSQRSRFSRSGWLAVVLLAGCTVGVGADGDGDLDGDLPPDDLPPGDNGSVVNPSTAASASFQFYNANTKHASFADIEKSDIRNFD